MYTVLNNSFIKWWIQVKTILKRKSLCSKLRILNEFFKLLRSLQYQQMQTMFYKLESSFESLEKFHTMFSIAPLLTVYMLKALKFSKNMLQTKK